MRWSLKFSFKLDGIQYLEDIHYWTTHLMFLPAAVLYLSILADASVDV